MPKNLNKIFYFLTAICILSLVSTAAFADVNNPGSSGFPGTQTNPTPNQTNPASNQTNPVPGKSITLKNPLGSNSIIDIINKILTFLIYISVPVLAFFVLWGGYQILGARGSPEKVKNGGKTIGYATLGFAVILVSKGIALLLYNFLK